MVRNNPSEHFLRNSFPVTSLQKLQEIKNESAISAMIENLGIAIINMKQMNVGAIAMDVYPVLQLQLVYPPEALQALLNMQIYHMDVKSDNIFIDCDGN